LIGENQMANKLFDLNIEEVLDNWEIEHGLREIIANALDEQVLSKTQDIQIFKDNRDFWHIRDYGRGLKIEHFTLNENEEKLNASSEVIGKFGVGLKDALATFHRRNVNVYIRSAYGTYQLRKAQKHEFKDIITLHIDYNHQANRIQGTEFIFRGVTDEDINKAKSLFLKFSDEEVLESNIYGQILQRSEKSARVYILGVLASEEPNFLFTYNITSLTETMRKRLNRERLNVGRSTYTDRVKSILKNAENEFVHDQLVDQVGKRAEGDQCDEMGWIEISQIALNLMHEKANVVYFTEEEIQSKPHILDNVRSDHITPIVITEQQKSKLEKQMEDGGPEVRVVEKYVHEFNQSFQYRFVERENLNPEERRIFGYTEDILALVGIVDSQKPEVRISETLRVTLDNADGVWDTSIPAIVIKRSKLNSLSDYSSTLLHEAGHAISGEVDVTRRFENVLSQFLGKIAVIALNSQK
jgi:hypothetical protein